MRNLIEDKEGLKGSEEISERQYCLTIFKFNIVLMNCFMRFELFIEVYQYLYYYLYFVICIIKKKDVSIFV